MTNMTKENETEPAKTYQPEETHYCDGEISYNDTEVTIDIAETHSITLTGHCKQCDRPLQIGIVVDTGILHVTDADTGETLHEY